MEKYTVVSAKTWRELERIGIKDRLAITNLNNYLQDAGKTY